ncbi:HNH endonuclease [Macrococcoides canis]|uniref:HNH endonuclease n=1 Tax=Macrococcoides canis TaxID=1855823 RepID=UPI00165E2D58|nr:HNH endonuclease [Macrococcus canis]QNR08245.1 HNH endonuclease [Macrococcus canis]
MRYCAAAGCETLIDKGQYCDEHRPKKKKQRFDSNNKSFYRSQVWNDARTYVLQRDRHTCQSCGKFVMGKQAHVHHIVPIRENPELKLDVNNLILYCNKCHKKIEDEQSPPTRNKKYSGLWG